MATSNPHKLDEIIAIWQGLSVSEQPIELVGLDTLGINIKEPVEDGNTFEANASIKAAYYARASRMLCLADDSGLEVDALDGAPGIYSARYAGMNGPRSEVDQANNRLLLDNLKGIPSEDRSARFVCAMALHNGEQGHEPNDPIAIVRGTFEGRIIGPDDLPQGQHGFGYDPLFYLPKYNKTSAELLPEKKNEISHRNAAARKMWDKVKNYMDKLN